jgi:hypothetical protein
MLEVVKTNTGRYKIRNAWTGVLLDGSYRTYKGAVRKRNRMTKRFTKTIARLSTQGHL